MILSHQESSDRTGQDSRWEIAKISRCRRVGAMKTRFPIDRPSPWRRRRDATRGRRLHGGDLCGKRGFTHAPREVRNWEEWTDKKGKKVGRSDAEYPGDAAAIASRGAETPDCIVFYGTLTNPALMA